MEQTGLDWLSELIECGADLDQIKKCIPRAKEMDKERDEAIAKMLMDCILTNKEVGHALKEFEETFQSY